MRYRRLRLGACPLVKIRCIRRCSALQEGIAHTRVEPPVGKRRVKLAFITLPATKALTVVEGLRGSTAIFSAP